MAEQVTRCPYCVEGYDFRPMVHRPEGRFVCRKCGHSAMPGEPDFKCSCRKCAELKRAA
jgi:hypothetical protein